MPDTRLEEPSVIGSEERSCGAGRGLNPQRRAGAVRRAQGRIGREAGKPDKDYCLPSLILQILIP